MMKDAGGHECDVLKLHGAPQREIPMLKYLLVVTTLVAGCSLPNRQMLPPRNIHQQQYDATQFDPYADNEVGPEIVGARPRDFQRQAPEAVRARGFRDTRWPF